MAVYHLSCKTISRAAGRSATGAAAYRSATLIVDERTGERHDYRRKGGVEHTEIVLPAPAPSWARDRSQLWNAAEKAETRKNSTVAREFEVALPAELDAAQRRDLALQLARELAERHGVAADVAIHSPGREGDQRNHHAHLLLSTRRLGPDGFTEKSRELDDKATGSLHVTRWRERWAELQNDALERAGRAERVDHRSLEAQGITDRMPTVHLGPTATAIERRGGVSEVAERAREQAELFMAEVQAQAAIADAARQHIAELEAELAILRLQALPLAQQRERAEQLVAERRAEIDDLAKRRTELSEMLHNRSQPRERVEEAHAKAPGLAKAARAAQGRAEALQSELEGTGWWRPFKRARLRRELPEAEQRAERLQRQAAEAQAMASKPIREKVQAALDELQQQIDPGEQRYHAALDEMHRVQAQEAAQKAQEAALQRQARAEAERERERALAAEIEANLGKWREKKPQQQRERAQDRDDGPTLGR